MPDSREESELCHLSRQVLRNSATVIMSNDKTTKTTNESRPPVSYLVALDDKLQMNAGKVERSIIETEQHLSKDSKKIDEGKQPLYQEHIKKTILISLELLNSLDQDAAEATRLQHPDSEMIEKDLKQLRERMTKLCEEHSRIYNCSAAVNWGKKIYEDNSEWEVNRPSEVTTDTDIKYSISSSEGQHECSETGLRWQSDSDVSLEYKFVDWKSLSKDILKNYKPCGPLMDITVTSGTLEEIQLPHFVCVDSESSSEDVVKVLHVKDGTVSVERCELSGFHAKIVNPTFSFLAIVVEAQQYLNMKFHCETLIYRNRTSPLNLHVYLILKDKKLKKDVEEKEQNNMEILKPTPDEALKLNDYFTLQTSCDAKIKPQSLKLTPNKTNFFDLHIKDELECLDLSIMTKEGQKIWDVNIQSGEFKENSSSSDWRQNKINRTKLIFQWWRRMLEVMEHSARAHLEASLLTSGSDMLRPRLSITFQERFSLKGHQSAETDTAQKQKRCKSGEGAEFVEKHRTELIRKVSLVEPIADDMKRLIGEEKYEIILSKPTTREKMRALLDFLSTPKMKDKLYKSLVKHEYSVVEYLDDPE